MMLLEFDLELIGGDVEPIDDVADIEYPFSTHHELLRFFKF